jgi:hypothetical protein
MNLFAAHAGTKMCAYANTLRAPGALWGRAGASRQGAAPRGLRRGEPPGPHAGEREGEGGREERGGEAHLGIRRSAATVHRITPNG